MGYTGEQKKAYQREWMRKRRQGWIDENGPCVDCGTWEDLEVDHVDPETKEYEPRDLWSRRKEVRDAELAKCVTRCHNCHVSKTIINKDGVSLGESHGIARATEDVVREIRSRYTTEKISIRSLAAEYDLARATVHDILRRVTWNHV